MSCHGKRSRGDKTDVQSKTERMTLDPEQPLCHSQSSSSPAVKILLSDSNLLAIGFANLNSSGTPLSIYICWRISYKFCSFSLYDLQHRTQHKLHTDSEILIIE